MERINSVTKGVIVSMIGCFRSASDDEIEALLRKPDRIRQVLFDEIPRSSGARDLFKRLFGLSGSRNDELLIWKPEDGNEDFDVDKAWHGIHFLLCGDPVCGPGVLGFIMEGGQSIGRIDVGYGPARAFKHADLFNIGRRIDNLVYDDLLKKCDSKVFKSNNIYPFIWDEPFDECFGYLLTNFEQLKAFIHRTLDAEKGMIVYMS